jgi:hypothetical protein
LPSAIIAGLDSRFPARSRIWAATLVAEEADHACSGQNPKVGELLRVDQTLDRLVERHAGRDKDGEDNGEARQLLAPERAEEESDPERHRSEGVTEVVDQVGQQRDRARQNEDRHLCARSESEDPEAE